MVSYSNADKLLRLDLLITLLLLVIAFIIRLNSFVDMDVAWHVEGAKRLLHGGSYITQVFDDNSPWVFYYYIPVELTHSLLALPYHIVIPLYVLACNLISLLLIRRILKYAFDSGKRQACYFISLFILIFLPLMNFGQREIILINFVMPYFWLNIALITQQQRIATSVTIICALLACLGILQNPLYLPLILIWDITKLYKIQRWSSYQTVFYLATLAATLVSFVSYPDYTFTVLRLVMCYEGAFNSSFWNLITTATWFCLLGIFLFLLNYRNWRNDVAIVYSALSMMICLIIYFYERKNWYYHLYPAYSFLVLLLFFILQRYQATFQSKCRLTVSDYINLVCTITILLMTLIHTILFLAGIISEFHDQNYSWNRWITYARQNFNNAKVFLLMPYNPPLHSLPLYANTHVVSPWFNTWFIPALNARYSSRLCNNRNDLELTRLITLRAIHLEKPDYILTRVPDIAKSNYDTYHQTDTVYLAGYHYLTQYDGVTIYKRD